MSFDTLQYVLICAYLISLGFCLGCVFSFDIFDYSGQNKSFWKELFGSFIPLVNTGAMLCVILLVIVDRFELHHKNKNDESDSIEW